MIYAVGSYKSKIVISGPIVEIYKYELPVINGFKIDSRDKIGRSGEASEEQRIVNREKVLNRARRDLRRLVNTNIKDISKFVTLTFSENIQDFEVANYEFKKFRQRLQRYLKQKVEYVCVPEFQKRGAIHFHVVFFNVPYIKNTKLSELWGQGFVKINRIDNVDNVGAYICKYMSKDFDVDERLRGYKCYFSSRGLDKPIEIKENDLVESVEDSLKGQLPVYENQFSNEHNTVSYCQYNMNKAKLER